MYAVPQQSKLFKCCLKSTLPSKGVRSCRGGGRGDWGAVGNGSGREAQSHAPPAGGNMLPPGSCGCRGGCIACGGGCMACGGGCMTGGGGCMTGGGGCMAGGGGCMTCGCIACGGGGITCGCGMTACATATVDCCIIGSGCISGCTIGGMAGDGAAMGCGGCATCIPGTCSRRGNFAYDPISPITFFGQLPLSRELPSLVNCPLSSTTSFQLLPPLLRTRLPEMVTRHLGFSGRRVLHCGPHDSKTKSWGKGPTYFSWVSHNRPVR